MSEFCEHIEAEIGLHRITYAESLDLHRRGCAICDMAIQKAVRAKKEPPALFWFVLLASGAIAFLATWFAFHP